MSARVLNPAMMSEMGHRGINGGPSRVAPSRAALERVRRDLFGPVDHAAARALAERELRAQSLLDAERWGFDFSIEKPRKNSRFDWKLVTSREIVPEPYALRGMPYLRKHAPGTPRKTDNVVETGTVKSWTRKRVSVGITGPISPASSATVVRKVERTPPQQETRVPRIDDVEDNERPTSGSFDDDSGEDTCQGRNKINIGEDQIPTTPVLPVAARKQQSSITDFMKSRKRSLNSTTKSIIELPEKIPRNAGQIRS